MILILSAIISFVVSLITCIVFFRVTKKQIQEHRGNETVITKQIPETEEQEEKENYVIYHSEPIKDYSFNNYFTDDPAFLEKMKSILDDYSSSNPIILRGPTGIGKTHLMRAFENYLLEKNPTLKTYFISAEVFTSEFIDSLKNHKINQFKEKYRMMELE